MNYKDHVRKILDLEERRDNLKTQAAELSKEIWQAEQALKDAIISGSIPEKFEAEGIMWKLDNKIDVTPMDRTATTRVEEWIKAHGGESLVKETIHAQSRNKFLRETLIHEDGTTSIPPELEGYIKIVDEPRMTRRTT